MPWCPKCGTEYIKGYDTCSDCKEKLTNARTEIFKPNDMFESNEIKEAFLISITDEYLAITIKDILDSEGIPVLIKDQGSGSYLTIYMGKSFYGKDIYVPSDKLNLAKLLVEDFIVGTSEVEFDTTELDLETRDEDFEVTTEDKYNKTKKTAVKWIVLCYLIPGLIYLVYSLYKSIGK